MKKPVALVAVAALATLSLAACSDPEPAPQNADDTNASNEEVVAGYDTSTIDTVEEIADLVPQEVKDRGVLRNGASTDYAPAEFRAADGHTPVGYDIEIVKALAKVMGLNEGETQHAEFPTIIPSLGSKFDIGASSFTITAERLDQVNMVSYVEVGSSYAVKKGNPNGFNPDDPCGTTIGVQTGTYQHEYANDLSDKCVADGKDKITVMPHDLNTDSVTKLIGGQYDAVLSDSTVTGYAISKKSDELEQAGDVIESEPQGIAINKADAELTEAVHKAMQYLMDEGILKDILAIYGADSAALSTSEVNPGQ